MEKDFDIRELAYELYKRNWIDTHSNRDMRLDAIRDYGDYRLECAREGFPASRYEDWFFETGFGDNIYACYDEFLDSEYQDADLMRELLYGEEMIRLYQEDVGKVLTKDNVKITWDNIGEGINGDYDPTDAEDVNLLRFTVYARDDPSADWVPAEGGSYCTGIPADTEPTVLKVILMQMMNEFYPVLHDEPGASVDEIGQRLSHMAIKQDTKAQDMSSADRYYRPEYDLDGTADELYMQARNGYVEDPDALHFIKEVLEQEGEEEKAQYISVMEETVREPKDRPFFLGQLKRDLLDGLYYGLDGAELDDGGKYLSIMFERAAEKAIIDVEWVDAEESPGELISYEATSCMTFKEFLSVSYKDFDRVIGETIAYNTIETGREPIDLQTLPENFDYAIEGSGVEDSCDSYRVYYTVSVAPDRYVDAMCIRSDPDTPGQTDDYEYIMENHDGSNVYDHEGKTYPEFVFDQDRCLKLAKEAYENEYKKKLSIEEKTVKPKTLTWDDINKKYPLPRSEMTEEQEREYVNDRYTMNEAEGFSKKFWCSGGDYKQYFGQSFEVLGRVKEKGYDPKLPALWQGDNELELLPMWRIRFADGLEIFAYPDEIIPSEMKKNGCPYRMEELTGKSVPSNELTTRFAAAKQEATERKTEKGKREKEGRGKVRGEENCV